MSAGSGTARSNPPSISPSILNIQLEDADTEMNFTVSGNIKQFILRSRNSAKLKIAFIENQTLDNFITLNKGVSLSQENLSATDLKIFVSSEFENDIIELFYWS